MAHQRTIIRQAIIARLTGATLAADHVLDSKVSPWRSAQLPGISVYTPSDPVDADSRATAPRIWRRNLQVKIECALAVTDTLATQLDAFELEVRQALDPYPTLPDLAGNPQCADMLLVGSEIIIDERGETQVGCVVITYEVPYDDDAPRAADQHLDDLNTVDAKYDLGGEQEAADQAEDTVNVGAAP